jgi:hypothetical protein
MTHSPNSTMAVVDSTSATATLTSLSKHSGRAMPAAADKQGEHMIQGCWRLLVVRAQPGNCAHGFKCAKSHPSTAVHGTLIPACDTCVLRAYGWRTAEADGSK